eukprot:CAMPEP_0197828198 /NCGR_PEP_ID=MMETSP1437-20131217/4836_1 /TAXON_ID=49252 ORGANISM="Eucampia antarctica, Strain CCMP1452" /NCGR_SAMPLE_ID=MMETSP1437 /ASSEMBLY_ACC=CAM_ASM_001096 /LENGTH=184 /DNA_ID=CAMNT_0043429357 /DNA_START=23 /DNA_END=577 /DNA_ORIENTATION=+
MTNTSLELTPSTMDDSIPNMDETALSNRRSQRQKMVPRYNNTSLLYPSNIYELSYITRFMYVPYFFVFKVLCILSQIFTVVLPVRIAQPFAEILAQTRAEDDALEEIPIMQNRMRKDLKVANIEQERIKDKVEDLKRRLQKMEERRGRWRAQAEKYRVDKAARDAIEQAHSDQPDTNDVTKKES